jgi:bilirubin oxidase
MSSTPLRRPRATIATASIALGAILTTVAMLSGCGLLAPRAISTIGEVEFNTPLPIPPLATPSVDEDGTRRFALDAQWGTREFRPGIATKTGGFNGPYLGPTIVADRGDHVAIDVTNSLDEPTTVHWHGMHLPAAMDGGPHQLVEPGQAWHPTWTIDQPAATLWYHPHPHGETQRQVGMGMAGLVLLHDDVERALPLPRDYGIDDVPVIVQDVQFDKGGAILFEDSEFAGTLGDTLLVNGVIGPFYDVTTDVVRLRLLNASTARTYDFSFDDGRELTMVASDGGLLELPLTLDSVRVSPGERVEVLVSMTAGDTAVLQSRTPDLGALFVGAGGAHDSFDVLQLRASESLETRGTIPATLAQIDRLHASEASAERTFTLTGTQINDREMDLSRVDEVVTVDTTEIWNVTNSMAAPHSFHIHDVQFQVLTIDDRPPPPELAGSKDTIYLLPNIRYRLIMRFEDYADPATPYMYHCHLLRHEDSGMMGQFVVVEPGQRPAETIKGDSHDHH